MKKKELTKQEKRELKIKKRQLNKQKGLDFFTEFKTFITRGNIIDMSIGVIVGTSFSKIATTLTNKIFMPWIAFILGDIHINDIKTILRPEEINENGEVIVTEIALMWGEFIQVILDFILIAFVIFITVKIINHMHKKIIFAKDKIGDLFDKDVKTEKVEVEEEVKVAEEVKVVEEVPEIETSLSGNKDNSNVENLLKEIRDLLKINKE